MASHRVSGVSTALPSGFTAFVPRTEKERQLIREQLGRILSSSVFRNSKRYASVLKYIVECSLDGTGAQPKERTIGIEVFGREPDYDSATDHVVRSAVAEVRKRLAQYYQETGKNAELRIEIQLGSYVPQFRLILDRPLLYSAGSFVGVEHEIPIVLPGPSHRSGLRSTPRRWWIAASAVVFAAILAAGLFFFRPDDPIESFWGPVLSSRNPVLLCVGNLEGGRGSTGDQVNEAGPITLKDFHRLESQTVHIADAVTLSRFAGFLQARGKHYHVVSQSEATFTDLQNGPAVLVGLMNNDWTERLVKKLRFAVEHPEPAVLIIRDHSNPSNNDWLIDYSTPYLDVTKDYALVLRVTDPKTEQMVVVAAGLSVFGTLAAGDFLTNPDEIKKLEAAAPKGWKGKNLELVLSTEVIRGKPGHANVIATYFW